MRLSSTQRLPIQSKANGKRKPASGSSSTTKRPLSAAVKDLLLVAKAKQREKLCLTTVESPPQSHSQSNDEDDSGSSGDENLVRPEELDLRSSFFDSTPAPKFDCNIGIGSGSDSDEDDQFDGVNDDCDKTEAAAAPVVDVLQNLQKFHKDIQDAQENLKKYKKDNGEAKVAKDSAPDISSLLALGEGTSSSIRDSEKSLKKGSKRVRSKPQVQEEASGESDWEEVAGKKPKRLCL